MQFKNKTLTASFLQSCESMLPPLAPTVILTFKLQTPSLNLIIKASLHTSALKAYILSFFTNSNLAFSLSKKKKILHSLPRPLSSQTLIFKVSLPKRSVQFFPSTFLIQILWRPHHQSEESQGHRLWLFRKTTTIFPSQVSVSFSFKQS